ncbi:hypothetical protein D9M71_621870 [compost metagenome]
MHVAADPAAAGHQAEDGATMAIGSAQCGFLVLLPTYASFQLQLPLVSEVAGVTLFLTTALKPTGDTTAGLEAVDFLGDTQDERPRTTTELGQQD